MSLDALGAFVNTGAGGDEFARLCRSSQASVMGPLYSPLSGDGVAERVQHDRRVSGRAGGSGPGPNDPRRGHGPIKP